MINTKIQRCELEWTEHIRHNSWCWVFVTVLTKRRHLEQESCRSRS